MKKLIQIKNRIYFWCLDKFLSYIGFDIIERVFIISLLIIYKPFKNKKIRKKYGEKN